MSYPDALVELARRQRFGVRPGLDRMRAALAKLGHPERSSGEVLHIAGTNGKGSTAAFAESMVRAGGARTGLYTSPHLSRFTERVRLAGAEIAEDEMAAHLEEALAAGEELSYFEVVTLAAFAAFRAHRCEVVVLETGLGGRLDATNVIDAAAATVVTGVALDHTEVLGGTLAEIAAEKAGIFKPGTPALFAADQEEVARVLAERARALSGREGLRLGRDFDLAVEEGGLRYRGVGGELALEQLGLAGAHQQKNAALALAAVSFLSRPPSARARAHGLMATRWPGRFERVDDRTGALGGGFAILDAAHNPDGARILRTCVDALPSPRTLVFGVAADKDAGAMLATLGPAFTQVILTRPPGGRGRDPEALRSFVPDAQVVDSPAEALALAGRRSRGQRAGQVVVAGSLFLVGEARWLLTGERRDPFPVQDPPAQKL